MRNDDDIQAALDRLNEEAESSTRSQLSSIRKESRESAQARRAAEGASTTQQGPRCSICPGTMAPVTVFRLGNPLGVIGRVILVLSLLPALFVGLGTVVSTTAATTTSEREEATPSPWTEARPALKGYGVPEDIIATLEAGDPVPAHRLHEVPEHIRDTVATANPGREPVDAADAAAGVAVIGTGLTLVVLWISLPGIIVGLLLSLRKRVLRCQDCSATVTAS